MRILRKLFLFFFTIYGFAIFLLWMLLLMPFFLYAFMLKPIRSGNMIYRICRFWADAFFFMTGISYSNIGTRAYKKNEEYIFVSNHISYLDIVMMMKVIRRRNVRILGKVEMTKIPIFGAIYKRGTVSVDRSSVKNRLKSINELIEFLHKKISVFICPEGTFNTSHRPLKSFYDGAFRIAIETQKPILPVLFLDTYDRLGYETIFSLNPGKCRSVFLEPTATTGLSLHDLPELKKKIFQQMEKSLIEYNATWINKKYLVERS
ncbi:MAG: lysophospholipid acyltransferase family protein [Ginsengibacter sp.]